MKLLDEINYGGTFAKAAFKTLLHSEKSFQPILGFYAERVDNHPDGGKIYWEKRGVRMSESNFYLYLEDGKPTSFFSFQENRQDFCRAEIATMHHLYVAQEFRGTGVASRLLDKLKKYAKQIDDACKGKTQIGKMKITEPFFSIAAYPNVFNFEKELDLEAIANSEGEIDFTLPSEAKDPELVHWDENVVDETYQTLDDETVLSEKQLRTFYESRGFTQSPHLMWVHPVKEGRITRKLCVSERSYCRLHKRPLVFPDNTAQIESKDRVLKEQIGTDYSQFSREKLLKDVLDATVV